MFDSLSEKLQTTLQGVRQRGALTEEDITRAMREIRLALLEADVNFKVVKQFTSAVKERCLGAEVQRQLNPGQPVVLAPAADGDPDGRPAGLRQDDRDRQARALPARGARLVGRRRRVRR